MGGALGVSRVLEFLLLFKSYWHCQVLNFERGKVRREAEAGVVIVVFGRAELHETSVFPLDFLNCIRRVSLRRTYLE